MVLTNICHHHSVRLCRISQGESTENAITQGFAVLIVQRIDWTVLSYRY